VDKRIRLESGRLNRPGGSNPSRSAMQNPGKRLLKPFLTYLVTLPVIGLVVFFRSIFDTYGRLDDYTLVVEAINKTQHMREAYLYSGRIFPALLIDTVSLPLNGVSDLVYLRLLSLFAVSLAAVALAISAFVFLRGMEEKTRLIAGLLVGLTVFALPGSPNAVTWSILCLPMFAMSFALSGGLIVATSEGLPKLKFQLLAVSLIFLSAFTYQHWVMLSVVPVSFSFAYVWMNSRKLEIKKLLFILVSCGIALGSNYLYIRLLSSESTKRTFAKPITESLGWFFTVFLPRSINLGIPDSKPWLVTSIICACLALTIPIFLRRDLWVVSALTIVVWLGSSAVVIPTENWASYRLIFPSQIVFWSGCFFGLVLSIGRQSKGIQSAGVVAMASVMCLLLLQSGLSGLRYIAKPNAMDWKSVRCVLEKQNPDYPINALVTTENSDVQSSFISYDEYGVVGSSVQWVLPNMYLLTSLAKDRAALDHPMPPVFPKWAAEGQEGNWISFPQTMCK
jgi:hypothetical protein